MATFRVEIDGGIETVTARTEKEAIRKAARKQGNSKSVGTSFGPKVKVKKIKEGTETTWTKDVGRDAKSLVALAKKNGLEAKATGNKVTITGDKKMITRTMLNMRYAYQAFSQGFKNEEIQKEDKMKTFDELMVELSEGKAANPAQQAAIAIAKKEKSVKEKMDPTDHVKEKDGKFCVYNAGGSVAKEFDNKDDADQYAIDNHDKLMATKKDVDEKTDPAAMARAMAAFKKRGGKIKKLAPGKAAGYHGKDDPGSDVHGMIGKSDTKGFGTRKKIGSMKK